MRNGKVKRGGLFTSKMILLLFNAFVCFTAVIGVTFALFVSEKDGNVGVNVSSGTVRVDIVDENRVSLIGKPFIFNTPTGSALFEPGACFYTQGFKIKNTGSVPIKFKVYVSNDDDFDMQEFSTAFEVYLTTNPKDLTSAEKVDFYTGELTATAYSETLFLVVKMKETASNYYKGSTFSGVGITVFAVQGNIEL